METYCHGDISEDTKRKGGGGGHRKSKLHRRARRGAVIFEFAITLPLMLLIGIAILDFSRLAFFYMLLADAVGAAGRYASTVPHLSAQSQSWQLGVERAAKLTLVGSPWLDPEELIVSVPEELQVSVEERRVTVRVQYEYHTRLWWPGIPSVSMIECQTVVYGAK
jgi:hypothetical protein